MSKPSLIDEDSRLESDIIETLMAGHKEWRPDLPYPESRSDMQGAVRALIRMFEITRRPIAVPLRLKCPHCYGNKKFVQIVALNHINEQKCEECNGKGYINGD